MSTDGEPGPPATVGAGRALGPGRSASGGPAPDPPGPAPDPPVPPQVIPRPADWGPGRPAAWSTVPASRRRRLGVERVEEALAVVGQSGPMTPSAFDAPAVTAEPREAPPARPEPGGPTPSAVLVALFEESGDARVLLTRRSSRLRSHRGEVSFPGGRIDPGETPSSAALREAAEEVALDPAGVRLVGWLHPLFTFSSSSRIAPVVGVLERRPVVRPNPAEVERVFDVALAVLVADGIFHEEHWRVPSRPALREAVPGPEDGSFAVWFFEVAGEIVWGATARVLHELVSLAVGVPPVLPG